MAKRIKGLHVPYRMTAAGYPESSEDTVLLGHSISEILKTGIGERVRNRHFGSGLQRLLFANMSRAALVRAKTEARRAIELWERRVVVDEILISSRDSRIVIEVYWRPRGVNAEPMAEHVPFDVAGTI